MASKVAEDTIIRREGLFFIILDKECEQIIESLFDHTFLISQAEGRCKHCAHELHQSVMSDENQRWSFSIGGNDPNHDDAISR